MSDTIKSLIMSINWTPIGSASIDKTLEVLGAYLFMFVVFILEIIGLYVTYLMIVSILNLELGKGGSHCEIKEREKIFEDEISTKKNHLSQGQDTSYFYHFLPLFLVADSGKNWKCQGLGLRNSRKIEELKPQILFKISPKFDCCNYFDS